MIEHQIRLEPQRVSCLLSDLDGVIFDSELVVKAVMNEVLEKAFEYPDVGRLAHELFGIRIIDIIALLEERLNRPLGEARRRELQREIDQRVAELAPVMPGALEVYQSLGLPVAVVSNSRRYRLNRCVERAGALMFFGQHVYSAEVVGLPKPAPDAYLHAARRLGCQPEHCLVIEDSVTGVQAARAAGMRVAGFLGGSHIEPEHAAKLRAAGVHVLFDDMAQLPQLIKDISGNSWKQGLGASAAGAAV
jgi:HAD superfamily hydrolase (TIGR01509 family)